MCSCELCQLLRTYCWGTGTHPFEISFEYTERICCRQDLSHWEANLAYLCNKWNASQIWDCPLKYTLSWSCWNLIWCTFSWCSFWFDQSPPLLCSDLALVHWIYLAFPFSADYKPNKSLSEEGALTISSLFFSYLSILIFIFRVDLYTQKIFKLSIPMAWEWFEMYFSNITVVWRYVLICTRQEQPLAIHLFSIFSPVLSFLLRLDTTRFVACATEDLICQVGDTSALNLGWPQFNWLSCLLVVKPRFEGFFKVPLQIKAMLSVIYNALQQVQGGEIDQTRAH